MRINLEFIANEIEAALAANKLIALPTETVYGLAAPIDREDLVAKIFTLKERPLFDPLIVHVLGEEQARELCLSWPEHASKLAAAFWPGPLTIVVPRHPSKVSDLITSGLDTVGIRSPAHPVARAILSAVNVPLVAPSANKFTKTSPTTIEHVKSHFHSDDVLFIEGGSSEIGLESTIVEVKDDEILILRRGIITSAQIAGVLGPKVRISFGKSAVESAHEIKAPGMHYIHYRPDWPVVVGTKPLASASEQELEKFSNLRFEERFLGGDPLKAARILYSVLQSPLAPGSNGLYLNISGLDFADERNLAIWDRLKKAASLFVSPPVIL